MKTKKILVMRHGESKEDVDNNIYAEIRDFNIPLTNLGKEQVNYAFLELQEEIKREKSLLISSPSVRVRQSALILKSKLHNRVVEFRKDPRLVKQNWGIVTHDNRKMYEEERYKVGVLKYKFPNGESGYEVLYRVGNFVNDLKSELSKSSHFQNVIIVAHGFIFRGIIMQMLQWSEDYFMKLANPPHCYIAKITLKDNLFVLDNHVPMYDAEKNKNHVSMVK